MHEAPRRPATDAVFAGGGEMGALMRALDWSAISLGPVGDWPQSLRTAVSICLTSRFPMLVWWGPDLVMLYNDAYRPLIGTKHPVAMGQRGVECFPEIWEIIGPMLTGVRAGQRDLVGGPTHPPRPQRLRRGVLLHLLLQPDP